MKYKFKSTAKVYINTKDGRDYDKTLGKIKQRFKSMPNQYPVTQSFRGFRQSKKNTHHYLVSTKFGRYIFGEDELLLLTDELKVSLL